MYKSTIDLEKLRQQDPFQNIRFRVLSNNVGSIACHDLWHWPSLLAIKQIHVAKISKYTVNILHLQKIWPNFIHEGQIWINHQKPNWYITLIISRRKIYLQQLWEKPRSLRGSDYMKYLFESPCLGNISTPEKTEKSHQIKKNISRFNKWLQMLKVH